LTSFGAGLQYPTIAVNSGLIEHMSVGQPANEPYYHPQSDRMDNQCRHPRVQVVSRDEDAEYVECLECREVFESSEFRDMDIESKIPEEEE
jgi:hypothetical protein